MYPFCPVISPSSSMPEPLPPSTNSAPPKKSIYHQRSIPLPNRSLPPFLLSIPPQRLFSPSLDSIDESKQKLHQHNLSTFVTECEAKLHLRTLAISTTMDLHPTHPYSRLIDPRILTNHKSSRPKEREREKTRKVGKGRPPRSLLTTVLHDNHHTTAKGEFT